MSSPFHHAGSGGFGITIHHEGQNDQNSIYPSPSGGTGDPRIQAAQKGRSNSETNESATYGTISEYDIKNNRP
ncbi:unnamed protein product [Rotaria sp. Silwood2]|nr:unnamed protein product [Rotaria sp. Silwood2]CAF2639249.1 unnamed protein product [Rotaria sp. Silwood2]CAF2972535.1 unnamed protein product [Rotaria sp. Silwood2]CAF3124914.1 unnamed protein product [Rotaria sp. Silwood2]CAF3914292.1 unnamed protein product [Rotaria sp. Silwood2]